MTGDTLHRARPGWTGAADPVHAQVRRLRLVGLAAVGYLLVASALAVVLRWPGQFAGPDGAERIVAESLTHGTALSPPVPLVLAFAGAVWLATGRHAGYVLGCTLLVLLSMAFIICGLGEARVPVTHDVPRAALVLSGATSALLVGAVVVTAVQRFLAGR